MMTHVPNNDNIRKHTWWGATVQQQVHQPIITTYSKRWCHQPTMSHPPKMTPPPNNSASPPMMPPPPNVIVPPPRNDDSIWWWQQPKTQQRNTTRNILHNNIGNALNTTHQVPNLKKKTYGHVDDRESDHESIFKAGLSCATSAQAWMNWDYASFPRIL